QNITGRLLVKSEGTSWVRSSEKALPINDPLLEAENKKEEWGYQDIARKVLNYRYRNDQHNEPGKEWEHIIEDSTNFPDIHSYENLALTTVTLNGEFKNYFGQRQESRPNAGLPNT